MKSHNLAPMKILLNVLVSVLLVTSSVHAQDWAKARLEKSPRHGEWVKVKQGTNEVESFITYPEVKEKATAVVVIHEIFGLSDWVRGVTDQLAEAGYIAIAPDLLSGKGPHGGGTADLGGSDGARRVIGSLPPELVTADLNAIVDYVSKLPSCNGKVVVIGFCWGGGQAFRFATNNKEIKATMVCYGPPPEKESDLARINCPVYGFYAEKDARITSTVPKIAEAMKAAGKTYEYQIYPGAGHGFMRDGEAPDGSDPNHEANKKARDAAWIRLKEILKKI
ncbi:MAG: Dienelactone hydrolase [Pedosphaera sp.]|nr:Dienelactone hydrolase [Pedosphaera sp.]